VVQVSSCTVLGDSNVCVHCRRFQGIIWRDWHSHATVEHQPRTNGLEFCARAIKYIAPPVLAGWAEGFGDAGEIAVVDLERGVVQSQRIQDTRLQ